MTALSTQRMTQSKWQGPAQSYPMGVAKIYVGSLVMINSAGYAVPASASAGNKGVVGVATETQDNTGGSAGDKWIDVREGCYKFACTTATQTNVGSACFAEDDQTVDTVQQEGEPPAGIIVEYVSSTCVWVAVGLAYRQDVTGSGGSGAMTLLAGADLSTKQYYAVKAGTGGTDYVSVCSVAGEAAIGILQNTPSAAGVDATVSTSGLAMFYTASGVTRGDALATSANGTLETATEGQVILGYALETVGATSTGHMLVDVGGITKALADGKLLVGNSSNIATAVAMSGDVTIINTGATTIGAKKVAASKMYSAAQGCIFRTDASNVVSELSLADGKIAVGDGTDVTALSVKTAGTMVYGNGTTLTTLAIGTPGSRLRTNASASAPIWDRNKLVSAYLTGMSSADAPTNYEYDFTAASGTTGALNCCVLPGGQKLGYWILGVGQTITGPVGDTNSINIACDQADNEGLEVFSNHFMADGVPLSVGFDTAFYFLVKLNIQTIEGCDDLFVGFRKIEAVNADMEAYDTYFGLGLNTAATPGAIKVRDELNGGGVTNTDTTNTIASGTDLQIKILVSATGVCSAMHDAAVPGTLAAPTVTHALTFDDGDQVIPVVRFLHANAAQAGKVLIKSWEVGLQ